MLIVSNNRNIQIHLNLEKLCQIGRNEYPMVILSITKRNFRNLYLNLYLNTYLYFYLLY